MLTKKGAQSFDVTRVFQDIGFLARDEPRYASMIGYIGAQGHEIYKLVNPEPSPAIRALGKKGSPGAKANIAQLRYRAGDITSQDADRWVIDCITHELTTAFLEEGTPSLLSKLQAVLVGFHRICKSDDRRVIDEVHEEISNELTNATNELNAYRRDPEWRWSVRSSKIINLVDELSLEDDVRNEKGREFQHAWSNSRGVARAVVVLTEVFQIFRLIDQFAGGPPNEDDVPSLTDDDSSQSDSD